MLQSVWSRRPMTCWLFWLFLLVVKTEEFVCCELVEQGLPHCLVKYLIIICMTIFMYGFLVWFTIAVMVSLLNPFDVLRYYRGRTNNLEMGELCHTWKGYKICTVQWSIRLADLWHACLHTVATQWYLDTCMFTHVSLCSRATSTISLPLVH